MESADRPLLDRCLGLGLDVKLQQEVAAFHENYRPNAEFRANPNRGLLIKGSKNLPWKEAYKVMNAINEGGMSTTVSLTATIGIPNMVNQFNVNRTLQQGDGAVEFFADSLTFFYKDNDFCLVSSSIGFQRKSIR